MRKSLPRFIVFVAQPTLADPSRLNALQLQFEHPSSGMAIGLTTYSKKNLSTGEWDRIGHIEWTSPLSGAISLGGSEV